MSSDWKSYFDALAPEYDKISAVRNIATETDFLLEELLLSPGARILDIGCGTALHAIELARRGFAVTGVDFSERMLAEAQKNAAAAGVAIDLVMCPAQTFCSDKRFDAALSLCRGGLCLFCDGDDLWGKDMAILGSMADVLKPGAKIVMTVLNALCLVRSVDESMLAAAEVDLITLSRRQRKTAGTGPCQIGIDGIERFYTPAEMIRMLNRVALKADRFYRMSGSEWQRTSILPDDAEFMVVGHRK